MARPRKWESDAQRRQAQNDARKAVRAAHDVPFIGVDGEGSGRWRNHKYVLLGVGDSQAENGGGLGFTEIFSHLYDCYKANPDGVFTGFFLGYDFTQWFKNLPQERARYLFTDQGIAKRQRKVYPQLGPFPVEYEGFEFDLLGMKRLKLRETGQKGWMYVCDAGSFFQASLMSVIDPRGWDKPVVTGDEYAILEYGKSQRDSASLDQGMRDYNALENRILAKLMGRLNQGFTQAGVRLKKSQWFGPGQAAQAWLGQVKAPTGESVRLAVASYGTDRDSRDGEHGNVPGIQARPVRSATGTPLLDAARGSYYGGWFEIFAHGHIPGRSWEYDINSAYPHIISSLPCLSHGRWKWHKSTVGGTVTGTGYKLVYASVRGADPRIGTMLHRCEDQSIRRPHRTAGWYWGRELHAASKAGLVDDIAVRETWTYEPCDCPPPLRGIAGLYDERIRVGKNTPAGKAYKLMYNSTYGKFAQSVGNPKYGNAFYASLITSGCREMIIDAIGSHPGGTHSVVMVATDGVYFTDRHPGLAIGSGLGEWEESAHTGLTLFKPGVHWDDRTRREIAEGRNPAFKARGINAKEFAGQLAAIDAHFARWPDSYPDERDPDSGPREGWYPKVTFTSGFSMVTCLQALQRGKWYLAGAVGSQELTQDADPIGKRHSGYLGKDAIYWSRPFKDGGPREESYPYDKRFGQPQAEDYGINDDGNVKDQWAQMMK